MRTSVFLSLLMFSLISSAQRDQETIETKAPPHHEVTAAVLLKRIAPEYPKKARKQHVEGTVRLHVIVAKDGSVGNLKIISGDPLLVDAALKAVRQWRYQPALLDGKPVEVDTTIDVLFTLKITR